MAKKADDKTQWEVAVERRFGDVTLEQIQGFRKKIDLCSAELERLCKRMNSMGIDTIRIDGHSMLESTTKSLQRLQINMAKALIQASS